jgi:hypothetical protein
MKAKKEPQTIKMQIWNDSCLINASIYETSHGCEWCWKWRDVEIAKGRAQIVIYYYIFMSGGKELELRLNFLGNWQPAADRIVDTHNWINADYPRVPTFYY